MLIRQKFMCAGTGAMLCLAATAWPVHAQGGAVGWSIERSAAADLWFHGLATVGFGAGPATRPYASGYGERMAQLKRARGVYPTPLDRAAEDLLKDLARDPALQTLHFVPLYFPEATREEFLTALLAVADEKTNDPERVTRVTRPGVAVLARTVRDGRQRGVLKRFVQALQEEWKLFYGSHWAESTEAVDDRMRAARARWRSAFEPSLEAFLTSQRLDRGTVMLSPALGPDGRLYEGVPASRTDNVVAVWLPPELDHQDVVTFSILHEMCYAAVEDAMQAPGVRASREAAGNAAVRCGSMVLDTYLPDLRAPYDSVFLSLWAGTGERPADFATAYPLDDGLTRALDRLIRPQSVATRAGTGRTNTTNFGWVIRPQPQADLFFHIMAVLAPDQPGPLAMYSASYATFIRDVKRQRGVYPTRVDSIGSDVRERLARPQQNSLHFMPLYFPRSEPEELIKALKAVVNRRVEDVSNAPTDVQYQVYVLIQVLTGEERNLLRTLVDAMEVEWKAFYRDYWQEWYDERRDQFDAMQQLWDRDIAPPLTPFLERRRLSGGLVMPSPGVGPEGRIMEQDPFDPTDQIVAAMLPVANTAPDISTFAFLKELCFLIIQPETLRGYARDRGTAEDLERTAAIRCGAMLLEFYAPILATRYRRAFLDAVGAQESNTQAAFERVFYLDPEIVERLRQDIRRDR